MAKIQKNASDFAHKTGFGKFLHKKHLSKKST